MKRWQVYIVAMTVEVILVIGTFGAFELRTSLFQSRFFSTIAKQATFSVGDGASSDIRFPSVGPFDHRLGYTKIPELTKDLVHKGYRIARQARFSPRLAQLTDLGLFTLYREKDSAGIKILDRMGKTLYQVVRPERTFGSYQDIPDVIVQSLLFIENREILDDRYPNKNPALEWDRLGKAVLEKAIQELYPERSAPGGSTLATQLEKYRHGFEGRTRTPKDKLQQMLSASFRSYLDGPVTLNRRYRIILDYINSIPLAALPGFGEVNGLGDGLFAWYATDIREVSELLRDPAKSVEQGKLKEVAKAYKQVLSLFIAHRRPSGFLLGNVQVLDGLTNEYLNLLASRHIISAEVRDAAAEVELHLRSSAPPPPPVSFLDRKAANAIRTQLLSYLGMSKLYDLDQVDVEVRSTIDKGIQDRVTEALRSLRSLDAAKEFGLVGGRTLDKGDPAKVVYSVTLYEHVDGANLLRVETDNWDRPFSINEGTRLDLGSTAKLRTLANYLDIVSDLFEQLSPMNAEQLKAFRNRATDPISQWAAEYFQRGDERTLKAMLDAAMERHYSASPGEAFFTGGGVHHFVNFKNEDNGKTPPVWEAIRFSINLPFIRLMRDLVRYYMAQIPGSPTRADDEVNNEARKIYLAKFADKEGSYFLEQFYQKYRPLDPEERFSTFVRSLKLVPARLAAAYRYVYPDHSVDEFGSFLSAWLPFSTMSKDTIAQMYEKYGPGKFSLQDQGYIARIHPLELWLVGYLAQHPKAKLGDVLAASADERQEVYQWLFKSKARHAQDIRIRVLIETEAFLEMHKTWKRFGYPFENLVPSYATAIGSSGDRPAALAELVGIILNDGIRYPNLKMEDVHFAQGTPFDTQFHYRKSAGVRVMKSEVAARLREAMKDVVENGTAKRAYKAFTTDSGEIIPVGGKTGTGDHRYDTYGPGGQLISSRVVNRTATFAFFIGDRFFGAVTAHVHGQEAANYNFTSALAAGLLKALSPAIVPMIRESSGIALRLDPFAMTPAYGTIPPIAAQFVEEGHLKYARRGGDLCAPERVTAPAAKPVSAQPAPAAPTVSPKPSASPKAEPKAAEKPKSSPAPVPGAAPKPSPASKSSPAPKSSVEKAPEKKADKATADKAKEEKPKSSPSPKPSAKAAASPKPGASPKPTATPQPSATAKPSPAPNGKSGGEAKPSPKATPSPTPTASKPAEKPKASPSPKPSPNASPSPKPSPKPSATAAASPKPKSTPKPEQGKENEKAPSSPVADTPAPAKSDQQPATESTPAAAETRGSTDAPARPENKRRPADRKGESDV